MDIQNMTKEQAEAMQQHVSSMTPDQAKGMEAILSQAFLNALSAQQGKDIRELKIAMNFNQNVSDVYFNGEKTSGEKLATVEAFNNTLKPCVFGEAKKKGFSELDGFEMIATQETFSLKIFGKRDGEKVFESISPFQLICYR